MGAYPTSQGTGGRSIPFRAAATSDETAPPVRPPRDSRVNNLDRDSFSGFGARESRSRLSTVFLKSATSIRRYEKLIPHGILGLPTFVVMLANRALHSFGLNREEDKNDISAIHIGDRAFSTGLLRESMARNLFRPALNYAQAKVRAARAISGRLMRLRAGAGGLLSTMRPDLSGFVALATNRENLFSGKEIVSLHASDRGLTQRFGNFRNQARSNTKVAGH